MKAVVSYNLILQLFLILLQCLHESHGSKFITSESFALMQIKGSVVAHDSFPSPEPQPFLPLLAPSSSIPIPNNNMPQLSGLCALNFTATESIMSITEADCWDSFAPYLANVVCCPQFDATLAVLIGQSSIHSGDLALNQAHANHCLSDVEQILESRGANGDLQKICSIYPLNLTQASCPVNDVNEFEITVDSSRLLASCEKIDPVNECCNQVCQKAILDAASEIALNGMLSLNVLPEHLHMIDDCKNIVLRWLASKLDPSSANSVLRGLSSCKINKVCPLEFPNMTNVARECRDVISNRTGCCSAMNSSMSQLQEQSFITNLQALNCASLLGLKLQQANVSNNVYNLCHVNLKDFSLQVGPQDSGCLLPSLPSDVTYDQTSGIGFICDLNDNIAAPWPSTSFTPASSCNKTTKLPTLPEATSAQSGLYIENLILPLLFAALLILQMLL